MASSSVSPISSFYLSSLSPSSAVRKQHGLFSLSISVVSPSVAQASNFEFSEWGTQVGFREVSRWNGLKSLSISNLQHSVKFERKRKRKGKGKGIYASLFGVGAPELLVIGVVALLVFGPKGLAEIARNLGKTLRAFQPTIRELQDVSREFKSTLEREIGLDDVRNPPQNGYTFNTSEQEIDLNGSPSRSKAYTSEDYLKITEEQLRAASAAQQQKEMGSPFESSSELRTPVAQQETGTTSLSESKSQIQAESQGTPQEAVSASPPEKPENER